MSGKKKATSVRISLETYDRINKLKAPKQALDGFIGQLLDLWEKQKQEAGPTGVNQGATGFVTFT